MINGAEGGGAPTCFVGGKNHRNKRALEDEAKTREGKAFKALIAPSEKASAIGSLALQFKRTEAGESKRTGKNLSSRRGKLQLQGWGYGRSSRTKGGEARGRSTVST